MLASILSIISSPRLPLWALVPLLISAFILAVLLLLLPAYTICLAGITIIRAKFQSPLLSDSISDNDNNDDNGPWSNISSSIFQGKVFHVRHRPKVHSFQYPLSFAVIDLDEASDLFGTHDVTAETKNEGNNSKLSHQESRGKLWPLSTLMLLRDQDHMKNGEGFPIITTSSSQTTSQTSKLSMKERIINLLYERTNGKLNLRKEHQSPKILLVTHLMYFGYCFNPVSFFFVLKNDEIEAVVVEVSNTPWNEMSIYCLHPDSVDTIMSKVYPSNSSQSLSKGGGTNDNRSSSKTYHYQFEKKFHVSPFMTMDHDYDWKFMLQKDQIVVQAQMYKHCDGDDDSQDVNNGDDDVVQEEKKKDDDHDSALEEAKKKELYFTAGFNIQRTIKQTTSSYYFPLQLSKIILRYPIYCFVIQIWIHYEAIKLLLKGIQFIPHPEGSETSASRAIAMVMKPVFVFM
ncbi:hypothetical protein ACHAWC_004858, partial [Mediolabrus comicus]